MDNDGVSNAGVFVQVVGVRVTRDSGDDHPPASCWKCGSIQLCKAGINFRVPVLRVSNLLVLPVFNFRCARF